MYIIKGIVMAGCMPVIYAFSTKKQLHSSINLFILKTLVESFCEHANLILIFEGYHKGFSILLDHLR